MKNFRLPCLDELEKHNVWNEIMRASLLSRLLPEGFEPLPADKEIPAVKKIGFKGAVESVSTVDFKIDDNGNVMHDESPLTVHTISFDRSGAITAISGFEAHDIIVSGKYGMLNLPLKVVSDSRIYRSGKRVDHVMHFHSSEKEKYLYSESGLLEEICSRSGARRQYICCDECEAVKDYDGAGELQLVVLHYAHCVIVQSRYVTFKCFLDKWQRVEEAWVYTDPESTSNPLKVTFSYNSHGNMSTESRSTGETYTCDFEYDSMGNWIVGRRYIGSRLVGYRERHITYHN